MRLGVAGLGLIGARHARAIAAHGQADLVAVIDPVAALRQQLADETGARPFADIGAVDIPLDGLILATPTPLHAEGAAQAAARGWPLLIEKPIAHTRADAACIAALPVPILIGHHRRQHRSLLALRDGLAGGRIGTPITASLIWAMGKPDTYFQDNWRSTDGSPVLINLVHDLDILRMLFGPIDQIVALPGARRRGANRVESGAIALGFDSGMTATIAFADTTPSPWGFEAGTGENPNIGTTGQDMLFIAGTAGGVSFPSLTWWAGTDWGQPATPAPDPQPDTVPLAAQLDHFLAVIGGATPLVNAADGAAALNAALRIEGQLSRAWAQDAAE